MLFREFLRRSILGGGISLLCCGLFFAAPVSAASCTPNIAGVIKTKETSVTVKIVCTEFAKKKVDVRIRVDNLDTDTSITKNVTATLDKNGAVNIKIDSLDKGTQYQFKVKIRKNGDTAYSTYSNTTTVTTIGADYDVKIDEIRSIKKSSVVLDVYSADLKKKSVTVQIRIKDKEEDAITTKTFDTTLDKSGFVSVKVDNLDAGTPYEFKARIKKNGETVFSAYSAAATTETKD